MSGNLEPHPLADTFPPMTDEEFQGLVDDIREHGLREPVVLFERMILDGRHRYRACLEAGVEPEFRDYDGADALGYIVSKNLKRRHLDESQRAMIAAKLANMRQGARTDLASIDAKSQTEAAKLLNVSRSSVQRASTVISQGSAELIAALVEGKTSVSAAAKALDGPKAPIEAAPETKHEGGSEEKQRELVGRAVAGEKVSARASGGEELLAEYEDIRKQKDEAHRRAAKTVADGYIGRNELSTKNSATKRDPYMTLTKLDAPILIPCSTETKNLIRQPLEKFKDALKRDAAAAGVDGLDAWQFDLQAKKILVEIYDNPRWGNTD